MTQAFCQPISAGIKIGIQNQRNSVELSKVGPFSIITSPDAGFDELSFHIFGRYEMLRFFVQTEFRYCESHISYILKNIDPYNSKYKEFKPFDVLTYSDDVNRYDFSIIVGYKVNKWLRFNTGLTPSFSSRPNYNTPFSNGITIDMVDDITRSYIRTQLYASAGVGVDWGRFSVDFTHERPLTPVSKTLVWRNEVSSFRRLSQRSFISVGYRFYPFPKLKRIKQSE